MKVAEITSIGIMINSQVLSEQLIEFFNSKIMSDSLDLTQLLPPEIAINGADSHLYRIGLSLYKPK